MWAPGSRANALGRDDTKSSTQPHLPECATDPGPFAFLRLEPAGPYEPVSSLVPGAVREIVAEHRRRRLRLLHDPERQVRLGQAHQSFFDMARGLILRDYHLETIDRSRVIALVEIVAADHHLLAGDLIASDIDLLLGADRILGVRELADDLLKRVDCAL